jgi:putative peptidoglycan lipid II flippase
VVNFARRIVAENALENAFLPVFLRLFHRGPRKKTWESASSIVNFSLVLALILSAAGIALTPVLITHLFPGLIAKGFGAEAIRMTRLMFPYLFLVTAAAVMATYLKAFNRFLLSESSAVLFTVGIVMGIFLFHRSIGLYSLAYGVLLGGVLQILFLLPFLTRILSNRSLEFSYRPAIRLRNAAGRKYGSQLGFITLDSILSQTASVVDKFFASRLSTGSLSYLYFAMEIFRLPFALISQAIASVIQKEFSEHIALFDRERARRLFIDGINVNLFLLTPISILMIVLAHPIVSLLLERFHFTAPDVTNTALALQFYSLGLVGWGVHILTTRIFAARLDSRTSLWLNSAMLLLNVGLCYTLVKTPLKFAGIALATSISFLTFGVIRTAVLKHQLAKDAIPIDFGDILRSMMKTVTAAMLMIIFIFQAKFVFNRIHFQSRTVENLILTLSLAFVGISTYFLSSLVLKNTGVLIFRRKSSGRKKAIPLSLLSPFGFWDVVSKNPERYQDEYRYKINLYLASPRWEVRNIGVKLIGRFQERVRADFLIDLLQSGRECGFLRRNALQSLTELGTWDTRIRALILQMLDDPYYEVRVAAFRNLEETSDPREFPFFRKAIAGKFARLGAEEKNACLRLIARKGDREDLPLLDRLYTSGNSLIREEVLELLLGFFRRGVLGAPETIDLAGRVLITSNHLRAEFRIKSLMQQIRRETEKT